MIHLNVIIPCYNGALWIERCLTSVDLFSRVNRNFQICTILVDDGSTDGSAATAVEVGDELELGEFILLTKPNGGLSSARNEALDYIARVRGKNATSEFVLFLDIDDQLLPARVSNCFEQENDLNVYDAIFNRKTRRQRFGRRALFVGNPVVVSSVIARYDSSRFDEKLSVLEDWDYWFKRVVVSNETFVHYPRVYLTKINDTQESLSKNTRRMVDHRIRLAQSMEEYATNREEIDLTVIHKAFARRRNPLWQLMMAIMRRPLSRPALGLMKHRLRTLMGRL